MKVFKGLIVRSLRFMRVCKALKYIPANSHVLDVGCGDGYLLMKASRKIKSGIGIDERISPKKTKNIELKKFSINKKLPFETGSFDVVTMTAFIEHLNEPYEFLRDVNRVLRKGGLCIITTPTRRAKLPWEILVKSGISDEEADEKGTAAHKTYFTSDTLKYALKKAKFTHVSSSEFEFGMNCIAVGRKN